MNPLIVMPSWMTMAYHRHFMDKRSPPQPKPIPYMDRTDIRQASEAARKASRDHRKGGQVYRTTHEILRREVGL